ncbi:MAG: tyrosine-type recombinase/integrase [Rhodospirillaceae bacterium]|nr:tyrosine-type recombinase/integrase [Rhodospirillaceae bacterium]
MSGEKSTILTPKKWIVEEYKTKWSGARVFRTRNAGKVWQFSCWIKEEGKYYGKSLRTRDLDEALKKAEEEYLELKIKARNGERVFAITIDDLCRWYIDLRQKDVTNHFVTKGRLITIKSQMKHLIVFIGSGTKVNRFKGEQFKGYQSWRRSIAPEVKTSTIRNEQATIKNLFKLALDEGMITHHQVPIWGKMYSEPVRRRDAFTPEQYATLYRSFRRWVGKAEDEAETIDRQIVRDFILIAANTGMRFGEMRRLRWHMVTRIFKQKGRNPDRPFVELNLPSDITKTRKERQVVGRAGVYFNRLKSYSAFTDSTDFVFADQKRGNEFMKNRLYALWDDLLVECGLTGAQRKPTFYTLRHTYATFRLMYGEVNALLLAQNMGCSISFLEQHYGHVRTADMVDALTRTIRENRGAFEMVLEP